MKLVAIDTETLQLPPLGTAKVNVRPTLPELVLVTWACREDYGILRGVALREDAESQLRHLLDRPGVTLVGHNVAFDLAGIVRAFPALRAPLEEMVQKGRVLDTRVLYLMRYPDPLPGQAQTLEYLARRFAGMTLSKDPGVRLTFSLHHPPTQEQLDYAKDDAEATLRVAEALLKLPYGAIRHHGTVQHRVILPGKPGTSPDVRFSRAAALMAWHLAPAGLCVDAEHLRKVDTALGAREEELFRELENHGLMVRVRVPGAAPEVVAAAVRGHPAVLVGRTWRVVDEEPFLYRNRKGQVERVAAAWRLVAASVRAEFEDVAREHGLLLPRSPKKGEISTRREDWKDYLDLLPESLSAYMELQKVRKYRSAFTQPLLEIPLQRVFPRYWVPGAATGRWSCSKPNGQQFPRKKSIGGLAMGDIYRAAPGNVLVHADYPQLELYCLCYVLTGLGIRGPLFEALESGEDLHALSAARMFGPAFTKEQRTAAKIANFSLAGGMGPKRFMQQARNAGLTWDFETAKDMKRRWLDAYPDVEHYLGLFRINGYSLRPPGLPVRVWLEQLGLDPTAQQSSYDVLKAHNGGAVFTVGLPDGRVVPDRAFSQACNLAFQGLGAAVISEAFALACAKGLPLVAVVHDSMTLECPWAMADLNGSDLQDVMRGGLAAVCPGVPLPKIQYTVKETWSE